MCTINLVVVESLHEKTAFFEGSEESFNLIALIDYLIDRKRRFVHFDMFCNVTFEVLGERIVRFVQSLLQSLESLC